MSLQHQIGYGPFTESGAQYASSIGVSEGLGIYTCVCMERGEASAVTKGAILVGKVVQFLECISPVLEKLSGQISHRSSGLYPKS